VRGEGGSNHADAGVTQPHLSHLALSQFRSHARARLDFDGRPVAVWGPNGSGKTNLLEAVSYLSPGRGLRRAGAEEVGRRAEGVGWKVAATLALPGTAHEVETQALPGEARTVRIDGKAASQLDLARLIPILWLVPAMDRLWTEGAEGRRRFLDRAALSLFPTTARPRSLREAMRERNRLLKDGSRDAHWYAALESQMAQAGTGRRPQPRGHRRPPRGGAGAGRDRLPAASLAITSPRTPLPPSEELYAQGLERGRWRDMAAGRSSGPHRADLEAVWTAKGRLGPRLLDRRAEGAPRVPDPRQRPRHRGGRHRAPPPPRRGRGPSRPRPAAPPSTTRSADWASRPS
jgi:DNA replication and repair protein RecF